jgi:hypothetical protein
MVRACRLSHVAITYSFEKVVRAASTTPWRQRHSLTQHRKLNGLHCEAASMAKSVSVPWLSGSCFVAEMLLRGRFTSRSAAHPPAWERGWHCGASRPLCAGSR